MYIKKINHTRLQWLYGAFDRPNFHKLSLTKHSAECFFFNTHDRAFQIFDRGFQTLGQAFEALKEKKMLGGEFEKLSRVFKKLGRVFVLQNGPCYPNQLRLQGGF